MTINNILQNKNFDYVFLNKKDETINISKKSKKKLILIAQTNNQTLNINISNNIIIELLEIFMFKDSALKYDNFNTHINLATNSKLIYNKLQLLNENIHNKYNFTCEIRKNSTLQINSFDFGSLKSKNHYDIKLNYKHSSFNINALIKTRKNTEICNIINLIHKNLNTSSSIYFKHILDNSSTIHFEALSKILKNASFSEAFQSSNTILLSNKARIFANPHLEIQTDELKASHGATTGSLDEAELFYLQQRGLSKLQSEYILLQAIENKIYDKIKNKNLKIFIYNLIRIYNVQRKLSIFPEF